MGFGGAGSPDAGSGREGKSWSGRPAELGERDRGAERARAAGRTGLAANVPLFMWLALAAANLHLKSPRVSARQRPGAQSPRRRAPWTPGRLSLWYISDLTSRARTILRWEPFWVHLGSRLGFGVCVFFLFFRKRCDLSTRVCAARGEPTSHPASPFPKSPRPRGGSHVGEGTTKARGKEELAWAR